MDEEEDSVRTSGGVEDGRVGSRDSNSVDSEGRSMVFKAAAKGNTEICAWLHDQVILWGLTVQKNAHFLPDVSSLCLGCGLEALK